MNDNNDKTQKLLGFRKYPKPTTNPDELPEEQPGRPAYQSATRSVKKSPLLKSFYWYINNQNDLVAQYDGKILAIKDCEVIGVFENFEESLKIFEDHEQGTVMIHECGPGEENYTATFHSPVFSD